MRPTRDAWFLEMAALVARRSTCLRRAVGAVLVNARGHVLATGYNGRARGLPHCHDAVTLSNASIIYPSACAGAFAPTGTALDACEAVHAEQNALLQTPDVELIRACYTTVSPCVTCTKLLLNTGCERIVFSEAYAHDAAARHLWTGGGPARSWVGPRASRSPPSAGGSAG